MYDVIIVGTRVAGSATARLLARRGMRVLALDRASFPSDTLSTHQVQLTGVARLARWGLLESLLAAGTPATRTIRFDQGRVAFAGRLPGYEGVDLMCCPRRTLLDTVLLAAARAAGAEIREDVVVEGLLSEGDRVTGVRARVKGGPAFTERARVVVGADGKRSTVARAVDAPAYRVRQPRTMAYYTYWSGVPVTGGEVYARPGRAVGLWPTNDGLVMTYVAEPLAGFDRFRRDVPGNVLAALDAVGVGERIRAGRRAERFRGTPDLPNAFRRPYGPGWALVGDAGLVMDPVTGQGICDALRDAELLADALAAGLDGGRSLDRALAGYQRARDRAVRPMYDFTVRLAALAPPRPGETALFEALAASPPDARRFLGALGGAVPLREFMSPANLVRLLGVRGFARLALGRGEAPAAAPGGERPAPTSR